MICVTNIIKSVKSGASEMAPQVKALDDPSIDPSSIHGTHIRCLTIAWNSSSREFETLFWPPWAPDRHVYKAIHRDTHTYTEVKIKSF